MGKTVFVLGELNVDAILYGTDVRPEPNKEKFIEDFQLTMGSSSAITACRLAQLGLDVHFVSVVGGDQFGAFCIERLQQFGINTEYVATDPNEKTGVTVSISDSTDRALLTFKGTIPKLKMDMIPACLLQKADHIHFGSFFLLENMMNHWRDLFQQAKQTGITTSFDTGWDPNERWHRSTIDELLEHTDYFVPSESELMNIYECFNWSELATKIPTKRGNVIVKRGKQGSSLLKPDLNWLDVAGFRVETKDTTGAGDSFNAGIIYGALHGKVNEDLLTFANACGALSTQHLGGTGGTVGVSEVYRLIAR